jgi:hypothetical protein
VAADLDRLDKIIQENNQHKPQEPQVAIFDKKWAGRN